jgi:hypothetical protein
MVACNSSNSISRTHDSRRWFIFINMGKTYYDMGHPKINAHTKPKKTLLLCLELLTCKEISFTIYRYVYDLSPYKVSYIQLKLFTICHYEV